MAPPDQGVISNFSAEPEPTFGGYSGNDHSIDDHSVDDRPVEADDYRTLAPGTNLPALVEEPRKRSFVGWLTFVVAVAGTVALIVVERNQIVHYWPPATRLYTVLKLPLKTLGEGLELQDVTVTKRDDSGALVLAGTVANTSKLTHEVPRLVAVIGRDAGKTPWRHAFPAGALALQPGETAHFETELTDPPTGGTSVAVTFTDQH